MVIFIYCRCRVGPVSACNLPAFSVQTDTLVVTVMFGLNHTFRIEYTKIGRLHCTKTATAEITINNYVIRCNALLSNSCYHAQNLIGRSALCWSDVHNHAKWVTSVSMAHRISTLMVSILVIFIVAWMLVTLVLPALQKPVGKYMPAFYIYILQ